MNKKYEIKNPRIKEIIEKADIVKIISEKVKLKKVGSTYTGLCPFHGDQKPSLMVSPQKQIFKCFVCGAGGNVINYVKMSEKHFNNKTLTWNQAVEAVGEMVGINISFKENANHLIDKSKNRLYNALNQTQEWYEAFLFQKENEAVVKYLQNRGFTVEQIKKYRLGFAPKEKRQICKMLMNEDFMFGKERDSSMVWNDQELVQSGIAFVNDDGKTEEIMKNRITIPIKNEDGQLIGWGGRDVNLYTNAKYINTPTCETFIKSNILFNFNNVDVDKCKELIVVEGYMDALAFMRAGYENVVALMGVTLSERQIYLIKKIKNLERVILCFDNDNAGDKAIEAIGLKLKEYKVNVFVASIKNKDYKDVDEAFQKYGVKAVTEIIASSQKYLSFLIQKKLSKNNDEWRNEIETRKILYFMVEMCDLVNREEILKQISENTSFKHEDLKLMINSYYDSKYRTLL